YPRDYLNRRNRRIPGERQSGPIGSTQPRPKNIRGAVAFPLDTDVFPFSNASLAAAGTNCYGAWVEDNPRRDINNRTMLVFSIFDGTNWSTATPVADDGTADFHPQLKAYVDGTAVVAWENEGALLDTEAGIANL